MCFPECSLADVGSTHCDRCRTQIPCLDRTRFEEEIEQDEYFLIYCRNKDFSVGLCFRNSVAN